MKFSALWTSCLFLVASTCLLRAQASTPESPRPQTPVARPYTLTPETRLRGFNVSSMNREYLEAIRDEWNGNSVRFHPNLSIRPRQAGLKTKKEYWPLLLKELEKGLDDARDLDMAVVITMPWLGLFDPPSGLQGNDVNVAFWSDEANLKDLCDAWRQIAQLCATRKDQVIWFDLLNEPLDRRDIPSSPKKWPDWAQQIINEIRTIDKTHPVVVEVGPGGLCWGFKDFPALKDGNIIYSFHQYQPHEYTHQGIKDIRHTDLAKAYLEKNLPWPGSYGDSGGGYWDQNRIKSELAPVFEFLKRNPGARMYVGEFSVVRWAPDGAQYLYDNVDLFEKNGWDWSYHSFREYRGWSLEDSDKFSETADPMPPGQFTDRAKVILQFLQKNGPPPS